jgi:hypothetical protein
MEELGTAGVLFIFIGVFSSCFKEDTAVVLPAPGDAKIYQVNMGEDYHRQVYFDCNSEDTLGSELDGWDLCFESSDSGWHIWINGGNNAFVANTGSQDFESVTSYIDADWKYDDPEWDIDSTAIGDWRINREVYLLDRGSAFSADDRYRKIIFQSVDESRYEIQFSSLDGSGFRIMELPKTTGNAFFYFSFDQEGKVLAIEPNAFYWDMLFTHYRTEIQTVDPPLPYLVTGVLINPGLAVAVDSSMGFNEVDYSFAQTLTYSSRRDIIGYNWKQFDFTAQAYLVKPYINYIIRDMEGVYWKLRFIDFYNEFGVKGHPVFEMQRL